MGLTVVSARRWLSAEEESARAPGIVDDELALIGAKPRKRDRQLILRLGLDDRHRPDLAEPRRSLGLCSSASRRIRSRREPRIAVPAGAHDEARHRSSGESDLARDLSLRFSQPERCNPIQLGRLIVHFGFTEQLASA
jgi:hypothetical protein